MPRCAGAGKTRVDLLRSVNGANSPGRPRQLESIRQRTWAKYLERLYWFKRPGFYILPINKSVNCLKKKKDRYQIGERASQRLTGSEFWVEYWSVNVCEAITQGWGNKSKRMFLTRKLHDSLGAGRAHRKVSPLTWGITGPRLKYYSSPA